VQLPRQLAAAEPLGLADRMHRAELRDGQVVADEELEVHRAAEGLGTEAPEGLHKRLQRRVAAQNSFA
jgi:hypothetical protein